MEALRAEGPFTSGDVDIQGDRDVVDVCARMLGARAFLPESGEDATNTGYIAVDLDGRKVGVNVLVSPYGVSRKDALAAAIPVDVGDTTIRVLHPVLCMESRLSNVSGLGRVSAKDLRQARASIHCAREFIRGLIVDGETRAALALNERIFRFCRSNMHARRALDEHGLDAFAAVDAYEGLPTAFNERRLPALAAELSASRVRVLCCCPGPTKTEFNEVGLVSAVSPSFLEMSAERCVRITLRALDRGRWVIVTGFINALVVYFSRRAPLWMSTLGSGFALRPRKKRLPAAT